MVFGFKKKQSKTLAELKHEISEEQKGIEQRKKKASDKINKKKLELKLKQLKESRSVFGGLKRNLSRLKKPVKIKMAKKKSKRKTTKRKMVKRKKKR